MAVYVDGKPQFTYAEHRLYPEDGRRHETIHGDHYVSPAPSTNHQDASRHIQFSLYQQIEMTGRGKVFDAPVDVQLTETDIVQPDIVVVLREHRRIVLPSRIRGIPDLVVEILSPSTADHDTTLKRALYERVGVPEYWIVDQDEQAITRYQLRGDHYGDGVRLTETIAFDEANVDLSRVWELLAQ